MKEVLLDVGELGWSFYLSAHIRWLRSQKKPIPSVMVLPGREALYRGLANSILTVPDCAFKDFKMEQQNRFTFMNVGGQRLREYFEKHLPWDHYISRTQPFDCHLWHKVYVGQMLFRPYVPKMVWQGIRKNEIHVFPRCRKSKYFSPRNLSISFYIDLLSRLCDEFKDCIIYTMGTKSGAYDINIDKENYMNFLDQTSIESLLSGAPLVRCAIGSQSAPLKLMLLQKVPSFMIGHEKKRHTETENWLKTKVGFYEIGKNEYNNFYSPDCIDKIVEFIKK